MKKEKIVKISIIVAIILTIVAIAFIGYGIYKKLTLKTQNPIATIEIEDYGTIKVELYPDQAPNTVTNFIALANKGYYNGKTFHRVIPGFMIQGGAKNEDGTGTPTLDDLKGNGDTSLYTIKGEMIINNYIKNKIKMEKGVIAMARTGNYSNISSDLAEEDYNSACAQFFIMHEDNLQINGLYAGFGKVIEGMDIVDKIANTEVTYRSTDLKEGEESPKDAEGNALTADMPINKPVITSITVDTFGVDYGYPETMEPFNYYDYIIKNYYNSMQEQ